VPTKTKRVRKNVRLAYLNLGDGSDERKLADLNEAFDLGAEIIGVSEHADRVDVTTRFLREHTEFARYYGDGRNGAAKECLLYKKSIGEATLKESITLSDVERVPAGAGPERPGPKVANRVRIRVAWNRRRLQLVVGHQYATVNNRREAARLFMNSLKDLVRNLRGVVIFFGDLNARPSHQLVRALRALFTGSSAPQSGNTHGNRIIDYVMVRGARVLNAFTESISSDHRMVVVDIRL